MSQNDKQFSATEVGALIERFDFKLSIVAERVGTLCEDMVEVKERLTGVETRLTGIEDAVRVNILPRISHLEKKAGL